VTTTEPDLYYDPYDWAIDTDPYPVWKRLRDEAPLYHNDRYEFFALSRFDDVKRASVDHKTYISGQGSVIELIRSGIEMPPGNILFEDPPAHDMHRGLLGRVFTPKRMADIEPKVREFCARSLDPLVGSGGFDFVGDLGAQMPMRTIGMLLGIPESDQQALRDQIDAGFEMEDGVMPDRRQDADTYGLGFGQELDEYIDWREKNPSDDLMTALLRAEFEDETGTTRRLTRLEILTYVGLVNAAGNETTTNLISWTGKVLAEHPDQRQQLVDDPSLIPAAIEELLRYEAPSPIQARYCVRDTEWHGQVVPEGSILCLLTASADRDERHYPEADRFDIHRNIDHHVTFGYGLHFCLGANLARLEGRVALQEVLQRWTTWDVDWEHAVQNHTTTVRGWKELPVVTG
jgi:cytochrome P450